jgi:hypothetical protein
MNDRQRLEAIVAVVCKYLPPDGISIEQAMSEIISLVDPLPPQRTEQEPVAWIDMTKFPPIRFKELSLRCDLEPFDGYALCFAPPAQPPQRTEQNFCSRCGKRTPDLTHIHTCTPPREGA